MGRNNMYHFVITGDKQFIYSSDGMYHQVCRIENSTLRDKIQALPQIIPVDKFAVCADERYTTPRSGLLNTVDGLQINL